MGGGRDMYALSMSIEVCIHLECNFPESGASDNEEVRSL